MKNLRIGMKVKYKYSFRPHRTATSYKSGTGKITGINNRSDLPITIDESFRIKRCEVVRIINICPTTGKDKSCGNQNCCWC